MQSKRRLPVLAGVLAALAAALIASSAAAIRTLPSSAQVAPPPLESVGVGELFAEIEAAESRAAAAPAPAPAAETAELDQVLVLSLVAHPEGLCPEDPLAGEIVALAVCQPLRATPADPQTQAETRVWAQNYLWIQQRQAQQLFSCDLLVGSGGARWYDPRNASWLSEDSFGDVDSSSLYAFVGWSPAMAIDPLGLESIRQWWGIENDLVDRPMWGGTKWVGYQAWNILTFGFLAEHDEIYETKSGTDYLKATAWATTKAGAKGAVVLATGGATASATAGLGAVGSGIVTGAAVGLSATAADDAFSLIEGNETHSLKDYAINVGAGAALGGLSGKLAQLRGSSAATSSPQTKAPKINLVGPRSQDVDLARLRASGPGAWARSGEAMSSRAAAYQEQITGRPAGDVYAVGGVKFDAFRGGRLVDAKGPGYSTFVRRGRFFSWFRGRETLLGQAQRQLAVANGRAVRWYVAEEEAATAIRSLLRQHAPGVEVVHQPPVPPR